MATAELVQHATEPGRVDVAVAAGELVRVNPAWAKLHKLPFNVFATPAAVRECPVGDMLFAAGAAWHQAPAGFRDVVGYEIDHPKRRNPIGLVVATRANPGDGMYHIIALDREDV